MLQEWRFLGLGRREDRRGTPVRVAVGPSQAGFSLFARLGITETTMSGTFASWARTDAVCVATSLFMRVGAFHRSAGELTALFMNSRAGTVVPGASRARSFFPSGPRFLCSSISSSVRRAHAPSVQEAL